MKKTFKSALALAFCVVTIFSTMLMASALGKPTVKVKSVTYNSVSLYWTTVSGADYYQIQRTTDGKNWTTLSSNYAKTSCTDSKSLTTGKSYGYRVRAVDKGLLGRLTYSAWTAMVTAKPVPAKVANLKVKSSNNTSVQLTWDKVAGASGYTVQYLSGSAWKTYKTTTGNTLNVTGLALGKTYSFRVAAYRTVSGKKVHGSVSATLKAGPTLNAPTTVALTALNTTALKIQWNASAGAKGYEIYNGATKKWVNTKTTKGIVISGLKPGTKYQFAVRAYSGSFKGTQSKTYTFQTAPAAPTGLKATDATNKSITFTWNKVTGAAGYQYQYYNHTTKKWSSAYTTSSNTVTVSGLSGNTNYGFKVRAYVTNSNVYKISSAAYGAFAPTIAYKTAIEAPTVTAAATSTNTITLKWPAVSGAKAYTIEKFDSTSGGWVTFDFKTSMWKTPANLTAESVTTTTALTFADKGANSRTDLYRVRAIDTSGKKGTLSAETVGRTTDVFINNTAATFNLQQLIRFPKVAGAVKYRVFTMYPSSLRGTSIDIPVSSMTSYNASIYETKICLAPKSIHSIMLYAVDANDKYLGNAINFTFSIGDLSIYASNHKYYNASVNSQLLYAARAINNTKSYTGDITVKNTTTIEYAIQALKILVNGKERPLISELVWALFKKEGMEMNSSETYTTTLNFKDGTAKNEENKTVHLKGCIEPSANSSKTAYLYNANNYAAWKNGIESVKTTKNSDGGYSISFTIKKETGKSNYHDGFMSSFNAADFGASENFNVANVNVGKSTVAITIGPDGILKSYKAVSPYSSDFNASFTAEEGSGDMGVEAGSLVNMRMSMSGNTLFDYTFTK